MAQASFSQSHSLVCAATRASIFRSSGERFLTKLVIGCLGPLVLALACQAAYTMLTQARVMSRGLTDKAASLTELMVSVAGPSLAFEDLKAATDELAYVKGDPDFAGAAIFDRQGKLLAAHGVPRSPGHAGAPLGIPGSAAVAIEEDGATVVAIRPVVTGGKLIGAIQLSFKTERVRDQAWRLSLVAALISLCGVLAAVAVVSLLARQISRRNRDMATLLDNTDQGFVSVDAQGVLAEERSAAATRWLGRYARGQTLWQAVAAADRRAAEWLRVGWENLVEGVFPVDVAIDQLPKRIQHGERTLRLEIKALGKGDLFTQGLVVLSDITADLAAERAEAMGRDLVRVLEKIAHDKVGFFEFLEGAEQIVEDIERASSSSVVGGGFDERCRRDIHTLKGNAAVFGLLSVSGRCHDLETALGEESEGDGVMRARDALMVTWREMRSRLASLLDGHEAELLEVHHSDLQILESRMTGGASRQELLDMVRSWRFEPVRNRLERSAAQVRELAQRLGRTSLMVRVEAERVRLRREKLQPFWQVFCHLLRNAVDHGIEPASERQALGKPDGGTLILRAGEEEAGVFVEVEDDGRGIDWCKVARRAQAMGLPHTTAEDLEAALFAEGVSTRDEASQISGRGVGLSAVRAACAQSKGRIQIRSKPGRGTAFRFLWSSKPEGSPERAAETPSSAADSAPKRQPAAKVA